MCNQSGKHRVPTLGVKLAPSTDTRPSRSLYDIFICPNDERHRRKRGTIGRLPCSIFPDLKLGFMLSTTTATVSQIGLSIQALDLDTHKET